MGPATDLVLQWLARAACAFAVAAAGVPCVRTGWWAVRVFDFPRLQLGIGGIAAGGLAVAVLPGVEAAISAALVGGASVWQLSHVVRFMRFWPTEVRASASTQLRLATANLDVRNEKRSAVAAKLGLLDADALLLIEVDDAWCEALADLRDTYPYRVEHVAGDGLGMVLWSRSELAESACRFLVSKARVSIAATVHTRNGSVVRFRGVHPTPPALLKKHGNADTDSEPEGRHDSRIRDAELVLLADEVAGDPESAWVVTGDFNDVAWSRTTRIFKRISGLRDPRVGRGLLNTYHARHPLLRYPLDHVMVSPGIGVGGLKRVRIPGSDHFGIVMGFSIQHVGAAEQQSTAGRSADDPLPARMMREGMTDATSHQHEA